jgi:hypothetical protein
MKHTFSIFLFFFFIMSASAQNKYDTKAKSSSQTRKGYIGLSLGAAIPLGKFASTQGVGPSGQSTSAGYATGGLALNLIQFQYQFHEMLAFNATWFGVSNSVDLDRMSADFFAGSGITGITATQDKPSGMGGLLLGLSLKKSTFPIYAKASIGYAGVRNAEVTFKKAGSVTFKQGEMNVGLGYEFGAGAMFQLGNHFGMVMEATYLGTTAKPNAGDVVGGNIILGKFGYDYSPSVFVLRAGLGYMF